MSAAQSDLDLPSLLSGQLQEPEVDILTFRPSPPLQRVELTAEVCIRRLEAVFFQEVEKALKKKRWTAEVT